ncbi:MAG: PH domain-containing protein [Gammaproteobacteria bacterium]
MTTNRFASKKDPTFITACAGTAGVCLIGFGVLLSQGLAGAGLLIAPLLVAGIALPLWLLFATDYRFEERTLVVRGGPFRWRIRIHEINTVRPTHNFVTAPALSGDRLCIDYGDGKALEISPDDTESFVTELQSRGGPPLCVAD